MSSTTPTAKLQPSKSTTADPAAASKPPQTNTALLEEDDEFEDFPVEGMQHTLHYIPIYLSPCSPPTTTTTNPPSQPTDWTAEESELPSNSAGAGTTHLWEESWDDDDENEDFSKQLR
jgi:26 proteasome complex subunit DSS1